MWNNEHTSGTNQVCALYCGSVEVGRVTIPYTIPNGDLTYYTIEVPEEKQMYSGRYDFRVLEGRGWAGGFLWPGNDCKINAVY